MERLLIIRKTLVTSWLVTESPRGINLDMGACTSNNQTKCILPPADQDQCRTLLNTMDFGQCHNLVDPMPYLMACQDNLCSGGGYCDSFEAYARKCQTMGVCLIWRSSEICPLLVPIFGVSTMWSSLQRNL